VRGYVHAGPFAVFADNTTKRLIGEGKTSAVEVQKRIALYGLRMAWLSRPSVRSADVALREGHLKLFRLQVIGCTALHATSADIWGATIGGRA
jgi:hypothetical protein